MLKLKVPQWVLILSPSLANLYMTWWEVRYIFSVENPFRDAIVWYGRYIDDLLLVWARNVAPIQKLQALGMKFSSASAGFLLIWDVKYAVS